MSRAWRCPDGSGSRAASPRVRSASPFLVFEELLRQHLDRHRPVEPRVPRPVDLAHPALADRREDLVGSEPPAGGERHYFPPRGARLPELLREIRGERHVVDVRRVRGPSRRQGEEPSARPVRRPIPARSGFLPRTREPEEALFLPEDGSPSLRRHARRDDRGVLAADEVKRSRRGSSGDWSPSGPRPATWRLRRRRFERRRTRGRRRSPRRRASGRPGEKTPPPSFVGPARIISGSPSASPPLRRITPTSSLGLRPA